jgi:hypothetical protein
MRMTARRDQYLLRAMFAAVIVSMLIDVAHAQRVPTKYNDRYQTLYAEQETFRKRPELLGCVAFAKDAVLNSNILPFNKLRFNQQSVQTAYVSEDVQQDVAYLRIRILAEGRIRAYSFLENWETAEINCAIPLTGAPKVSLEIAK